MRQAAVAENMARPAPNNSSMRSNLVANAQPISFSGAPVFDSNVWLVFDYIRFSSIMLVIMYVDKNKLINVNR